MVDVKRVYDEISKQDGDRILVDRLWPRGIKKADLQYDAWLKAIAPSTELRQALHSETIDFAHFEKQYRAELQQNEALTKLKQRMEKQKCDAADRHQTRSAKPHYRIAETAGLNIRPVRGGFLRA